MNTKGTKKPKATTQIKDSSKKISKLGMLMRKMPKGEILDMKAVLKWEDNFIIISVIIESHHILCGGFFCLIVHYRILSYIIVHYWIESDIIVNAGVCHNIDLSSRTTINFKTTFIMPEFLKKTSTVTILLIVAIVGLGIYFYKKGKTTPTTPTEGGTEDPSPAI